MKRFAWMLSGMLLPAGAILPCAAQEPPVMQATLLPPRCPAPCPCPTPGPTTPADPSKSTTDLPTPPPADDLLANESGAKGIPALGNLVAGGTGLSVSANVAGQGTLVQTPLILPGLFTAASVQSAIPMDRVSFDYGYYSAFQIPNPATLSNFNTVTPGVGTRAGFNLNTFNVSVEKTFFSGLGSVYVSVPFLLATDNISGQSIDGLGDVSVGAKIALYTDRTTGSTLSAGLTVTTPTGRNAVVTSSIANATTGNSFLPSSTTRINPTFFQPWVAGVLIQDRFVVQEYLGVVVPTDDSVATFINNNVSVGYTVYRSPCGLLSSLTPIASVQALIPLNHIGTPGGSGTTINDPSHGDPAFNANNPPPAPSAFGFTDQVFVTGGMQFGIGERGLLSTGVVTPVVGPKGYSVGFTVGFSLFF